MDDIIGTSIIGGIDKSLYLKILLYFSCYFVRYIFADHFLC